jgi:hypothetical protein
MPLPTAIIGIPLSQQLLAGKVYIIQISVNSSTATRMATQPSKRQICPPKCHPDGTSFCIPLKPYYFKRNMQPAKGLNWQKNKNYLNSHQLMNA